jgi:hypothetical protein
MIPGTDSAQFLDKFGKDEKTLYMFSSMMNATGQ